MAVATGGEASARCRNCDRPASKLGRLVWPMPSGKVLYSMVCRFCYAQLQRRQAPRIRR